MRISRVAGIIAATAMLASATASSAAPAAPSRAQSAERASAQAQKQSDLRGRPPTGIVALLALLAVAAGIIAAASNGDSTPESP
jgi:hypothetical protein